ncbi:MAG: response regulator [Candidatus Heimdallarchaeota archaeon]|nr:response regulator [Candidatus Heimdallarchaeota archaeon]
MSSDDDELENQGINFFIIDDSRFIRAMEEKMLTKMGHNIIAQADNGEDAIEMFVENWFDVDIILLDVVMPKMDGLRTLKGLLGVNPYVKVIMVTSISSSAIVQGCLAAGAVEFVVKPFRISEFMKTVQNVIEMEERTPENIK